MIKIRNLNFNFSFLPHSKKSNRKIIKIEDQFNSDRSLALLYETPENCKDYTSPYEPNIFTLISDQEKVDPDTYFSVLENKNFSISLAAVRPVGGFNCKPGNITISY